MCEGKDSEKSRKNESNIRGNNVKKKKQGRGMGKGTDKERL